MIRSLIPTTVARLAAVVAVLAAIAAAGRGL